jgi:hypothetical protein
MKQSFMEARQFFAAKKEQQHAAGSRQQQQQHAAACMHFLHLYFGSASTPFATRCVALCASTGNKKRFCLDRLTFCVLK